MNKTNEYLDKMREEIQYLEFLDEVKWFQEHYEMDFKTAKQKVLDLYVERNK